MRLITISRHLAPQRTNCMRVCLLKIWRLNLELLCIRSVLCGDFICVTLLFKGLRLLCQGLLKLGNFRLLITQGVFFIRWELLLGSDFLDDLRKPLLHALVVFLNTAQLFLHLLAAHALLVHCGKRYVFFFRLLFLLFFLDRLRFLGLHFFLRRFRFSDFTALFKKLVELFVSYVVNGDVFRLVCHENSSYGNVERFSASTATERRGRATTAPCRGCLHLLLL